MLLEQKYREIVSGERRGAWAAAVRGGLGVLERPYRWAMAAKSARFDQQLVRPHRASAPVISVGNLTVGGTGKSPLVVWLARWVANHGVGVTIISRGYGSQPGRPNDEALEMASQLPGVPHIQDRDRIRAANTALAANPRQVLILDDGFQHRRMARDIDIVLLDALAPFGYDRLLPRGLLREPVEALSRAQVVALSRSDAITEVRRMEIERRVRSVAPAADWLELRHRPTRLVTADGAEIGLSTARGMRVAAFCGIGNPAGFRHTLTACGLEIAAERWYPDHCTYAPRQLAELESWAVSQPGEYVVCTRKDLVKIPRAQLGGKRLLALEIEQEIVRGREAVEAQLQSVIKAF